MPTDIRPEITPKSQYWIPRHRYYELKHFCLQYSMWKDACEHLNALSARPYDLKAVRNSGISDPTAKCAEAKAEFDRRMKLVDTAIDETTDEGIIAHALLKGVTEGLPYEKLKARYPVPCCKDAYYALYRRFFYILDKKRG